MLSLEKVANIIEMIDERLPKFMQMTGLENLFCIERDVEMESEYESDFVLSVYVKYPAGAEVKDDAIAWIYHTATEKKEFNLSDKHPNKIDALAVDVVISIAATRWEPPDIDIRTIFVTEHFHMANVARCIFALAQYYLDTSTSLFEYHSSNDEVPF